jgi:hypothetical protein
MGPENDAPSLCDGFPTTPLLLDANAKKRYRQYFLQQPGPHIEIRNGRGVVIEPTPEEMRQLSSVYVVKASENGITYTQPEGAPDTWVEETFALLIAEDLGIHHQAPEWADQPAITLIPANRPTTLQPDDRARPFSTYAVWNGILEGQAVSPWYPGRHDRPSRLVRTRHPGNGHSRRQIWAKHKRCRASRTNH